MIISGGEDTTLRLSYIDKENNFRPAAIIRSFLSSVRAISFFRLNNSFLVASAGGRAQLKIWKIDVELGMEEILFLHLKKLVHTNLILTRCIFRNCEVS